jgi:zinc/manganese transport system permease protein
MTGTTAILSVAGLSANPVVDLRNLLAYPFMVNAFRAGAAIAILAGVVGWFMVLRRQSFVGHTIAVVGFPGAAGAVLLGLSAFSGYVAFCVLAAALIAFVPAASGRAFSDESAVTGTVQALLLGFGFLFASLYGGSLNGIDALLFGNFLGISNAEVVALSVICVLTSAAIAALWRPLLFASIDPGVALARGLPVRRLGAVFLVLLGLAAAGASQMTGALLVFALLVMPAATIQRLTSRPAFGLWLTLVLAIALTWAGLAVSYYSPYPIGFWITTIAFGAYVLAQVSSVLGERRARRRRERALRP